MPMFDRFMDDDKKQADQATAESAAAPAADGESDACRKVKAIIEELRPFLQADGGDIEFVDMKDSVVYVRLVGSCIGCPSSTMTLKAGVETRICEAVPEVKSVEMA
jgi:Fe-S cluster biogenesis protein NfuA